MDEFCGIKFTNYNSGQFNNGIRKLENLEVSKSSVVSDGGPSPDGMK